MTNRVAAVVLGVAGVWAVTERLAAAQTARITISVDGTAALAPLKRVWAYYGYDEVNYTTTPEGRALLSALAGMHDVPVHVRSHFLLNTNAGAPRLKVGVDERLHRRRRGQPQLRLDRHGRHHGHRHGERCVPARRVAFMPQALSVRPHPYRNSSVTALDGGLFYPPSDYQKWVI